MKGGERDTIALCFPYAESPPAGTLREVAPGVRWLRMPLPFALDHINLWLVEDGEGWAIIDTGIASDAIKTLWQHIVAQELGGRTVTRLIVTHFHPDHIGLAGWLGERLGVELWTTPGEWDHARRALADRPGTFGNELADFYRRIGFGDIEETVKIGRPTSYRTLVSALPKAYRALHDGMEFEIGERRWRVIIGRGHAPEHACLYCPSLDLVIAGDQVLPKISPNISLWPHAADQDPLGSFLASLDKLEHAVPPTAFVLPSHNLPFYGLHARTRQLRALHGERVATVVDACATPRTGADIVPVLFRRTLDRHQLGFAIGETMAHLAHAVALGHLARRERADGVWLFERV
jgi:glyoxylase-like metal-dependent hydrolase (beta-lactamase superfamily II)